MNIDMFTISCCLIIVCAFVASWYYISKTETDNFQNRKKWIDQLPSVVSTLGVLGTFLGITRGLLSFDTSDLDTSIPLLLDGLKTAFFTSLFGMAGSLVLNRIVSHKFDTEEKPSEIKDAAQLIVNTLKSNHDNLLPVIKNNKELVRALTEDDTTKLIRVDVEQLKDDIEEIKGLVQELKDIVEEQTNVIKDTHSTDNATEELSRLRAVALTATASIATIDNNVEEINNYVASLKNGATENGGNVERVKSTD